MGTSILAKLAKGCAAQAATGREERGRFEQVGFPAAVFPRQHNNGGLRAKGELVVVPKAAEGQSGQLQPCGRLHHLAGEQGG